MVVGLCTFPPLGRVSQVKRQAISFSAVLEADDHEPEQPWEICLWYSSGEQPWAEATMSLTEGSNSPNFLQLDNSRRPRFCYTAELPLTSTLRFTIKYRSGPAQSWSWARDELGVDDGLVILNAENQHTLDGDLSHIIKGLNPELKVRAVASQTPRTQLWTIEAVVGPSNDGISANLDVELGTPWGDFVRYFALVRHSAAWLGPRHGKTDFTLDKDALLCSFLSRKGKHLVLLGISSLNSVVTLLRSSHHGSVMAHIRSDESAISTGMILAAVGDNCESAIAAAIYHARALTLSSSTQDTSAQELVVESDEINPEWMQEWCDGLGYCTWNALGQQLTEDKLLDAVKCLKENDIHISNLIIDDNWQDVDYHGSNSNSYGWKRFEAEPRAFPNGLKHTISQVRQIVPGIEKISVWHTLLGYWGGISPDGEIAQQYQTVEVPRDGWKVSGPMTVIASADITRFYDDFYRFLVSCDVDGVKTDGQFMIDTWSTSVHRRGLTNTYLDAWAIASTRHFGAKAISCMSQVPQIIFRQQLSQTRPTIPVRNSDDYFPDEPNSHPWHIWANAHNSLFTQHLNVFPDWDMFQTAHETAYYHAAARCISGGPIYITDVPGHYDLQLINQMTGLTPRGKTVILRPSVVGRTVDVYTGYDVDALLKVGCYNGKSSTGTPILGVFNTRPHAVTEIIPFEAFPGVVTSAEYLVRSHFTGKVAPITERESQQPRLGVTLKTGSCDIFTAYPLTCLDTETNGRINTASLGLIDKMTGGAALITNHFESLPTGKVLSTTRLKALGTLGLYISDLPHMSIERDFMITIQGIPIPVHTVRIDQRDTHVLSVDIQTAWMEMGLSSGWSNEVEVKISFDAEHV